MVILFELFAGVNGILFEIIAGFSLWVGEDNDDRGVIVWLKIKNEHWPRGKAWNPEFP